MLCRGSSGGKRRIKYGGMGIKLIAGNGKVQQRYVGRAGIAARRIRLRGRDGSGLWSLELGFDDVVGAGLGVLRFA